MVASAQDRVAGGGERAEVVRVVVLIVPKQPNDDVHGQATGTANGPRELAAIEDNGVRGAAGTERSVVLCMWPLLTSKRKPRM